jgi:pimeloyl-ACP methyl ester carboxylesterase
MTSDFPTSTVELSAGPIDYLDSGGDGPTVVLLRGVLMNYTVWRGVIAELTPAFRCVAPTLPLGAHRQPNAARSRPQHRRHCLAGCGISGAARPTGCNPDHE